MITDSKDSLPAGLYIRHKPQEPVMLEASEMMNLTLETTGEWKYAGRTSSRFPISVFSQIVDAARQELEREFLRFLNRMRITPLAVLLSRSASVKTSRRPPSSCSTSVLGGEQLSRCHAVRLAIESRAAARRVHLGFLRDYPLLDSNTVGRSNLLGSNTSRASRIATILGVQTSDRTL